jgi:hypothetical protein
VEAAASTETLVNCYELFCNFSQKMVSIDNWFTGFKQRSPSDGSFEVDVPDFVISSILNN